MVLRSFVVALALAALTGCPRKTEGGLVLKVTIEPGVRGDCLIVDATSSGTRASRSTLTRQAMKGEYFIGISRGDFPASLDWQASVYQSCTGDEADWKLSSRSASKAQAFPTTGVQQFELVVGQPDATLDADRDTWVDTAKGGADCNDADAQVNPGARQACASTIDTNCNGKLFCDDSTCSNEPACTTTATGLSFSTTLPTLVASDCSGAVTVQSVANGRPAAVASDVTVTLAPTGTPSAGLELFSDSACMTRLTSSTLPLRFGTNQVSFSFRARTPGALTLTASAPSLGSTSLTTTITDRPVVSLGVNPGSVSARAGECSTAIDVTTLDDRMMPTNVSGMQLALAIGYLPAGTNTVEVFSDATCMTSGVPSIPVGASSRRLYLKGTRVTPAGMPIQVQLSSPTLGAPTSLDFVVTAGDPHHLEFTTQVLGTRNNECSRAPAELRLYDANSNLTTAGASGVDVALEGTPPSGGGMLEFFTSPGCAGTATSTAQIPAGQSSVLVYLRPSGPGTYGVTARTTLTVPTASLQVDVSTMDPTALYFPSAAVTLATTAGTCSPAVRLQTRELNASTAPVSPLPMATTVTIAPSVAVGVAFFSDANCMMALTANQLVMGAGSSEVSFYFRANRASSLTLSASATNFITTSPVQPIRIGPAPTSKLVFDTPAVVSAVAGQCSGGLVLRSFDSFDNPTSASGAVTPAAAPVVTAPDGVVFSSAPTCAAPSATVTMTDGGVTFYASARRAQQYTITATGFSAQSTDAGLFTVDAGGPTVFAVVSQPMATVSASECTPITLERRDSFGNPSPVGSQSFSVAVNTTGVVSVHGDSASCTAGSAGPALSFAAGQTRATFYARGRLVGMSTLTATATGVTMSATTTPISVIAAAATTLRFATGTPPASSAVGGCLQATLERIDAEGNLTGLPADLGVSVGATGAGSGNGLVLTAASMCGAVAQTSLGVTFMGSATSTTFSYSPRAPGALTFTATGTGLTSAVATTTVAAGALSRVAFVSPPTADQAYDGCVPLQLEALDVGGNRVPTDELVTLSTAVLSTGTFFANATCTGGTMNTVTVVGMGVGSFWFKPLPAALGMVTVHATPSVGVSGRASVSLNIVAGAEAKLSRNDFPATNTAGDCVNFTVTRLDSGDHPAVGALRTVVVTATGAASVAPNEAQLFVGMGCSMGTGVAGTLNVDIAAAASSATFSVRLRKVGAITIATASNPLSAPANTTTSVGVGPLANITFSTTPSSLAGNTCSPAVTVNGTDSAGNAAALGTQALSMANATFFSDMGCSTVVTDLVAGAAATGTFFFKNTVAGASVVLTVGTAPSATQNWTITTPVASALQWKPGAAPPSTLSRFTCSSAFRVQVTDGMNPVATVAARTLSFAPLVSTGFRYFTDSGCTTPVTGSFQIAAGQSESPDLYAYSFVNGTFNAVATDTTVTSPLTATPAAQVAVSGVAPAVLTATPASTDLLYRGCVGVVIRRTLSGADFTFLTTNVNVTVGNAPPATAYSLHLASDCSDVGTASLTNVPIASGSAFSTVYVRGRSAEPTNATVTSSGGTSGMPASLRTMTVIATDAASVFTAGTSAAINLHPAVRRGACTIEAAEASTSTSSARCLVLPALPATAGSRSFVTTQAIGTNEPGRSSVECRLDGAATEVTCQRVTSMSGEAIEVRWQVVTIADAVVLSASGTLSGAMNDQPVTFGSPVSAMSGTFLLLSVGTSSAALIGDDNITAELTSTTTAVLRSSAWPSTVNYTVQAVQLPGALVERGTTAPGTATGLSATATTTAPGGTSDGFVLHSGRMSSATGSEVCKFRFRSVITNDTTLTFTRALASGSANCANATIDAIAWERPTVPNSLATVQRFSAVTINGNTTTSSSQNLGNQFLGLDRVWTFVSGQGLGGQCGGETNVTGAPLSYSQAHITYNRNTTNTRFLLTRGAQGGSDNSTFSVFALTFAQ